MENTTEMESAWARYQAYRQRQQQEFDKRVQDRFAGTAKLLDENMRKLFDMFKGRSIETFDGVFNGKAVKDWTDVEFAMYYFLVAAPREYCAEGHSDYYGAYSNKTGLSEELRRWYLGPTVRVDEVEALPDVMHFIDHIDRMELGLDEHYQTYDWVCPHEKNDYPFPPTIIDFWRKRGILGQASKARDEEEIASKTDEELLDEEILNADQDRTQKGLEAMCSRRMLKSGFIDQHHARILRYAITKFPALKTEYYEEILAMIEGWAMSPEKRAECFNAERILRLTEALGKQPA